MTTNVVHILSHDLSLTDLLLSRNFYVNYHQPKNPSLVLYCTTYLTNIKT